VATAPVRILLACMPKSGSTFLSDVVGELPDFLRVALLPSFERREQELDEGRIQHFRYENYIAQHHVRHSDWTEKMCRDYGLKPVVLVRSLLDAVVSLRDHIRRESAAMPMLYAEMHHGKLDDDALEDMIVRLAVPWYVNFYMSWRNVPGILMISYEELIADPERLTREVLSFAGADVSNREIAKAVNRVRVRGASRFNIGVVGRGAALRPETIRNLVALFDFYPEAANDPYVKGLRTQAAAALEGRSVPMLGPMAMRPSEPAPPAAERPRLKSRVLAAARRYGYQVTLIAVGFLYWIWPEDILPDDKWYGRIDDAVFLTILAFLAGRVGRRTPRLRNLPSFVARGLSRKLRFTR
jgi:hypothetical protein